LKIIYSHREHPDYFKFLLKKEKVIFAEKTIKCFDLYKLINKELHLCKQKENSLKNFDLFYNDNCLYSIHDYLEPIELERFIFLKNLRRKKSGVIMMKTKKLEIENNG
jgi:hypothetical protein